MGSVPLHLVRPASSEAETPASTGKVLKPGKKGFLSTWLKSKADLTASPKAEVARLYPELLIECAAAGQPNRYSRSSVEEVLYKIRSLTGLATPRQLPAFMDQWVNWKNSPAFEAHRLLPIAAEQGVETTEDSLREAIRVERLRRFPEGDPKATAAASPIALKEGETEREYARREARLELGRAFAARFGEIESEHPASVDWAREVFDAQQRTIEGLQDRIAELKRVNEILRAQLPR